MYILILIVAYSTKKCVIIFSQHYQWIRVSLKFEEILFEVSSFFNLANLFLLSAISEATWSGNEVYILRKIILIILSSKRLYILSFHTDNKKKNIYERNAKQFWWLRHCWLHGAQFIRISCFIFALWYSMCVPDRTCCFLQSLTVIQTLMKIVNFFLNC